MFVGRAFQFGFYGKKLWTSPKSIFDLSLSRNNAEYALKYAFKNQIE